MYASTWICTKEAGIVAEDMERKASLDELQLGVPAMHIDA
jgi:hypothetical protein